MILLFTDFGLSGPYTGQMKAVLAQQAPTVPAIDLFADAPAFDPQLSAYLLAAYAPAFPAGSVFLSVVDPGVGTERRPVMVEADGRWFVGPDNGLFALIARRATSLNAWKIDWIPDNLSASFHGRDLFAPVAASLATGRPVERSPLPASAIDRPGWPDELPRIVYVDVYGNAMTGLRASTLPADAVLIAAGTRIARARTFGAVGPGQPLWYENSNGLAEIAVNRGRADRVLGLAVGDPVTVET
ncbi:SAM hydrolase/SAM-dependent halogenase family protein [Azospirillum sp. B2RO_4]|uniref:SAM hydrolase/SAM-dependent halogenase family protein n=1 Tax=Azospirillum sp. B2RO_4 TaxID=3027796 RepID=UPI003DA9CD71